MSRHEYFRGEKLLLIDLNRNAANCHASSLQEEGRFSEVRENVEVKLLEKDDELYILAK